MSDEVNEKKSENELEEAPKPKQPERLPFLLAFTFSAAQLLVILMGILTVLISMLSGADLFTATLRSAASMLAVGFLLWLVSWLLSKHSLELAHQDILKEIKEMKDMVEDIDESKGTSTVEKVA